MQVVVIGGGVIGLLTAHHLRKRGAEVTLVDRGRTGAACSAGNAGWITPSIAVPIPSPEIRSRSWGWLFRPDSPLYIRPSAIPALAPFLLRFWRHCNRADFERGCRALASLAADTHGLFEALEAEGLSFEQQREGLLMIFGKRSTMAAERALLEAAEYGPIRLLTPDEVRQREPAIQGPVVGGIHVLPETHLRPELLCAQMSKSLRAAGVDVIEGTAVERFNSRGSSATEIQATHGSIEADAFVIATGAESARLASQCGTRIPMQAGKGYSVTVEQPATRVQTPLYLAEAMIGVAPFRGALRVAGTMELSGLNEELDPRRVAALRRSAESEIPGVFEGTKTKEWVGMRPLTPDGLPMIGRLPSRHNVFIASGHQMAGVLLAPSTGRALAEVILDGEAAVDLEPFSPGRFSG